MPPKNRSKKNNGNNKAEESPVLSPTKAEESPVLSPVLSPTKDLPEPSDASEVFEPAAVVPVPEDATPPEPAEAPTSPDVSASPLFNPPAAEPEPAEPAPTPEPVVPETRPEPTASTPVKEEPSTPPAVEAASPPPAPAAEVTWETAEKRIRELLPQVTDASVLKELTELADVEALEKLVLRGKPAPKAQPWSAPPRTSVSNNIFKANEGMKKSYNSQEVAKTQSMNIGIVDNKSLAVGGAGAGGGLGLNRPGAGPKVNHFAGRGSLTGGAKSINIDGGVSSAWSEMMDDKSDTSWVIADYSADGKTISLQGKGEGGLNSFKAQLPEGIAWGGFRCNAIDKRGGLECKRPKFVFVCYKPESCSAIKKAKQASHKGDVKEAFPGAHVDVIVEMMDDLDEQKLITQLQSATGAHKPNGYEFESGTFLEADFYGLGIGKSCKGESSKN